MLTIVRSGGAEPSSTEFEPGTARVWTLRHRVQSVPARVRTLGGRVRTSAREGPDPSRPSSIRPGEGTDPLGGEFELALTMVGSRSRAQDSSLSDGIGVAGVTGGVDGVVVEAGVPVALLASAARSSSIGLRHASTVVPSSGSSLATATS